MRRFYWYSVLCMICIDYKVKSQTMRENLENLANADSPTRLSSFGISLTY